MMNGPMMQAVLEEGFKLRIHRETREIPVYVLTVAKGGIKMKPFQEGSCIPIDFFNFSFQRTPGVKYCRVVGGAKGGMRTFVGQATSIEDFSKIELGFMDRPVIDKTGISGLFDIYLEFVPDSTDPGGATAASDPAGPSIYTALQEQLGLKLEPAQGPAEFVIIDHVERPSGN
jgi:uncharacterized protein (TIGR03435 family)